MATVYIDIVFIINFVISLLILAVTKRLLRLNAGVLRLSAGGLLCGVYALLMLIPQLRLCYTLPGRVVFSVIMLPVAFSIKSVKALVRTAVTFYIVTFVFGGAVYGAAELLSKSSPVPLVILAASTAAAYFSILFVSRVRKAALSEAEQITEVTVRIKGKSVTVPCLVDTGNSLSSPILQRPVTVVEQDAMREVIPEDLSAVQISYTPYKSVGVECGALLTVRADSLTAKGHTEDNALIALYGGKLSPDNTYRGLLSPALFREEKENENLRDKPEKSF